MLGKWKCPNVNASVAWPDFQVAACSAAVCIAGQGAPKVRTDAREKECPSVDASAARPGGRFAARSAAASIAAKDWGRLPHESGASVVLDLACQDLGQVRVVSLKCGLRII